MPIAEEMAAPPELLPPTPVGTYLIGFGGAVAPPGRADLRLGPDDAARWLGEATTEAAGAHAAAAATAAIALAEAEQAEGEASGSLEAARAAAAAAARRGDELDALEPALKQAYEDRRSALAEVHAAAVELASAVAAWQVVDERHREAEAAVVALINRSNTSATVVDAPSALQDMVDAEEVVARASRRCASVVGGAEAELRAAHERLLAAEAELQEQVARWGGTEPGGPARLPIVGLRRLRRLLPGEGLHDDVVAAEGAVAAARLHREEAQAAVERLAGGCPPPDAATVVVEGIRQAVAAVGPSATVEIDDILGSVPEPDADAVLAALAAGLRGRGTYRTRNPRVLAWAISVPPEVADIVGFTTP